MAQPFGNAEPQSESDSAYNFGSPVDLRSISSEEPLFGEIVRSEAFQRLSDIRFLGGIDYLIVPNPNGSDHHTRYTRFQHSLGVARLALHYSIYKELPQKLRRLAYVSALLHDIGHAPLSHSVESVFEEKFGINHHIATRDLIYGRGAYGRQISDILESHGLDRDEVVSVLEGGHDPFEGFFSGPINFDTIEGIMRSRRYLKFPAAGHTPMGITRAAIRRDGAGDQEAVDSFWEYKNEVYNYIIRSRQGVIVDYICQHVTREHMDRLSADDYFITEKQFFRKIPELRKLLYVGALSPFFSNNNSGEIKYKTRRFFVDYSANFFERDDSKRYRQVKEDQVLAWPGPQLSGELPASRDLFDEPRL